MDKINNKIMKGGINLGLDNFRKVASRKPRFPGL